MRRLTRLGGSTGSGSHVRAWPPFPNKAPAHIDERQDLDRWSAEWDGMDRAAVTLSSTVQRDPYPN